MVVVVVVVMVRVVLVVVIVLVERLVTEIYDRQILRVFDS